VLVTVTLILCNLPLYHIKQIHPRTFLQQLLHITLTQLIPIKFKTIQWNLHTLHHPNGLLLYNIQKVLNLIPSWSCTCYLPRTLEAT